MHVPLSQADDLSWLRTLYSGKIWQEINFGGLMNLNLGHQFKNLAMF